MFTARSNCIKFANITKSPTRIVDFVSNFSNAPKLVRDYFDEVKCKENLRLFPREILRRSRRKNPEELYAAVDSEAIRIADAIESKRNRNVPLLEVNPGPGVLTKYIHNSEAETRLLLENRPDFILQLKPLLEKKPNLQLPDRHAKKMLEGRTNKYYQERANRLWGNAANWIIEPLQSRNWDEDIIGQAIVIYSSCAVLRTLCKDVILQNGLFSKGRVEIFMMLPAIEYVKMTCGPDIPYYFYRDRSALFQILFEHEYLLKVDRRAFVPWQLMRTMDALQAENMSLESDYFYLTRMVPRSDLLSKCTKMELLSLYYFVCQCLTKRTNWVIPKLEKWISGCGAKLICRQPSTTPAKPLHPSADQPKWSRPSMELSVDDHLPAIHTFTESGELTPEQIFTLFHWFKSLPEYKTCGFADEVVQSFLIRNDPEDVETNKFKRIVPKI